MLTMKDEIKLIKDEIGWSDWDLEYLLQDLNKEIEEHWKNKKRAEKTEEYLPRDLANIVSGYM